MTGLSTHEPTAQDRLWIRGLLARKGVWELGCEDLAALPAEHQIDDVRAYSRLASGRGVRLHAVIERVGARPEAHYLNLIANEGRFRAALFRSAVAELGIVIYSVDGRPMSRAQGGPFHLLLPGFRGVCQHVLALETLEFSTDPGPDDRLDPLLASELSPIASAFEPRELVDVDPAHPRTWIVPPRLEGEPQIASPGDLQLD